MKKFLNEKLSKKANEKIKSYFFMTLGVMIASFAFSFFLNPNNIVIGGVSGIGVIFKERVNGIDPAYIMLILNVLLLGVSFLTLGKEFFIKTVYGALSFPLFVKVFNILYGLVGEGMAELNSDIILVILFSSIIMGYGLGLVVKYGGSTGGTEIPQKIMYQKLHLPYSFSLYLIDGAIVVIGYFLIKQDFRIVLYEIIFMVISGLVMDTTIFSGFNKRCVHIISDKCDEIKGILLKEFARGVTGVKVVGEYTQTERKMIICLLSTIEYYKLREIVGQIDDKAFFYCVRASEVRGEGFTYDSPSE